jgi:hypothetical protein
MTKEEPLLSTDMQRTADSIRTIRGKLNHLLAEDHIPDGTMELISIVLVDGMVVVQALEQLAKNGV